MNIFTRLFAAALATAVLFVSCHSEKKDTLRTGDLVFVGIPIGYSLEGGSMDEAIASATGREIWCDCYPAGIVSDEEMAALYAALKEIIASCR